LTQWKFILRLDLRPAGRRGAGRVQISRWQRSEELGCNVGSRNWGYHCRFRADCPQFAQPSARTAPFLRLVRSPGGGLGFQDEAGKGGGTRLHIVRAETTPKARTVQGPFELSTGKCPCLAIRCRERQRNTRYCGLLLTCTTWSGIFSSAAVNRL
jgi:hypothetical protein